MRIGNKRGVILSLGLVIFFIALIGFLYPRWILGISGSDSLLSHLFIVDKKDKDVKRGDIVGFYYQGVEKYGFKKGDKFLKYIACDEGDRLTVKNRKYFCNEKFISEAIKINSFGDPVVAWEYNGTVPRGKFFTFAPYKYSYDSRYWGFANRDSIIGKAHELF